MFRSNFLKALMAVSIVSLTMAACNKEDVLTSDLLFKTDSTTDAENRFITTEAATDDRTARRGDKCFQLNYPITIVTAAGAENSFADRAALKAFHKTYRADGGEKSDLMFAYPIEVTLEDGTLQMLANAEEMEALKETCPQRERGTRGESRGDRKACFEVVFPINATAADGSALTIESARDLKQFKRSVKIAMENETGVPTINYPIEITIEEENVSITSQTALEDLRENCAQN